jgi:hypothetical protein
MKPTRKIVLTAALILVLLAAGICAVLWQRPREIILGPVTAEAVNPDAAGVSAVVEADLVRQRGLFGGGSLRGTVTVDGVSYFGNELWDEGNTSDSAGTFFRRWNAFSPEHATVEDAVNLTSDGVVTVWLHDGALEITRYEGGILTVFRVPVR